MNLSGPWCSAKLYFTGSLVSVVNCRVFRWFEAGWRARLQILWISNEKLQEASGRRARVTHLDKTLADEAKFGRNIFLNQRTGLIWDPPTAMRGDMEWKSIFKVHNFAPRAMSIFFKSFEIYICVTMLHGCSHGRTFGVTVALQTNNIVSDH